MPELDFYTVREVAKMLKINVVGVYELIKEGELKAHRFSERRTRVHRTDLQEFIEGARLAHCANGKIRNLAYLRMDKAHS